MNLPRNHFSPSQLTLWEKSPKAYVDVYINNKPIFETVYLKYGKRFSEDMEQGFSDDPIINEMVHKVERGVVPEYLIKVPYLDTTLLGIEDSENLDRFLEYKTGTVVWTQETADNSAQLHFYAFIRKRMGYKIYNQAKLIWLPTHFKEGRYEFTGEIKEFEVNVTEEQITNIEKRIVKALKEIKAYKIKGSITL